MCSDCQANNFQLTQHPSEGRGDLICRGGTLPGHPAWHVVPPTHSQRWVKPSFSWVHATVAVLGPGQPSKKCHTAKALPGTGASWGPSGAFPRSCQRPPASQQAPVGQAKPAAAPPQNASKKPAASRPHCSCISQSLDTLPAFHWLQEENTQTSTKPHQQEVNLCKQSK